MTTQAMTMNDVGAAAGEPAQAMTLDRMPHGKEAIVADIAGDRGLARRLMEMGLVGGTKISVVRAAPFGDPIEVLVRGYHLTLRRAEAAQIRVARAS